MYSACGRAFLSLPGGENSPNPSTTLDSLLHIITNIVSSNKPLPGWKLGSQSHWEIIPPSDQPELACAAYIISVNALSRDGVLKTLGSRSDH